MKLRQKVEAALLRQAAKEAGRIRAALKTTIDVKQVVDDFLNQNFTAITPNDARAWTRVHVHPKNQDNLRAAVRNAIATGYAMGEQSAKSHFAQRSYVKKAAPTKADVNAWLNTSIWDNWKPGHQPAALLLKPKGGLFTLLDRAGATINGLNRTTLDRIGTRLADGLARGATSDEIADDIDEILNDPQRALTIANTEMARAMSTASMDTYEGFGVEMVEWLHSDYCNCDLCNEAEDLGPQPVGYDWSQGEIDGGVTEPPMHPNCICSIAPVVDMGDPADLIDVADSIDLAASATLVKEWNEEDHPRDEYGRFGSGDGSDSSPKLPEPLDRNSDEAVSAQLNFQREQGFTADNNPTEWDMAVSAYTSGSGEYYNINGYLRQGDEYFQQAGMSPIEQSVTLGHISSLDAAIAAAPPLTENSLTYRGISSEAAADFMSLEVGDSFTDAGYSSTSWDKEVAKSFARDEEGVVLQIVNPAGTQGIAPLGYRMEVINRYAPEKEWILPRNSTFDVIAKEGNVVTVRVNNEVSNGR